MLGGWAKANQMPAEIIASDLDAGVLTRVTNAFPNVRPVGSDISQAAGQDIVFAAMNVLLGTVIVLFLLFEPKGVMHRVEITKRAWRLWPFPY